MHYIVNPTAQRFNLLHEFKNNEKSIYFFQNININLQLMTILFPINYQNSVIGHYLIYLKHQFIEIINRFDVIGLHFLINLIDRNNRLYLHQFSLKSRALLCRDYSEHVFS